MAVNNPKNFEFKLGKQGLALFVAGMSFLLLMVFVLGVMVGVNIDAYPEKIARSLPDIIRRQLHRPPEASGPTAAVTEEIVKAPPPAEQSMEENSMAASLPEPFVSKEELPRGAPGAQDKKTPLASPPADPRNAASMPQGPAAVGVAKMVAKPLADAAIGKSDSGNALPLDSKDDSSARPANGEGKYSVQVASFKSRNKAKQFCDKIVPLGFKPRVAMIELPNKGQWFRVTVDGFPSREEAKKATVVLEKNIKGISGVIRPSKK